MKTLTRDELDDFAWADLESSQVKRVAYLSPGVVADRDLSFDLPGALESGVMLAEFHGGAVYAYGGVTWEVVEKLINAESVGRELSLSIKKVGYPYVKLEIAAVDDDPALD